jgi:microcystin-dependent protein
MPRNGSGTYSLPEPPFVAGTIISSAAVNDDLSDIAVALTGSLPRNGEAGMLGQFKGTDGNVLLPGISFINDANTGIFRPASDQLAIAVGGVQVALFTSDGFQGQVPFGVIVDFAGSTTPVLWLLCYGQNVSRTTYASLFAVIGTTYGSGDGVTTFGLPDLRGRAIFGKDNMGGVSAARLTTAYFGSDPTVLGNVGGAQTQTLITANLPAYTPTGTIGFPAGAQGFTQPGTNVGVGGVATGGQTLTLTATFTGAAQGGTSTAFGIINPGFILNKIIYAGA